MHNAAVLFYLEAVNRFEGAKTCTQGLCTWNVPTLKKITYLPIKDIDFSSAKAKKQKLDQDLEGIVLEEDVVTVKEGSWPTDDDFKLYYSNISQQGTKPSVLSLIAEHSDNYVLKIHQPEFPQPLSTLRKAEYIKLNYYELLQVCETIFISITQEMCNNVETETRTQSKSKLWYKYRAGRVTASRMRAVCHTSLANPSPSLVKSICYPDVFCFTTKATEWGCSHEHQARELYVKTNKPNHQNFRVIENGLFINPEWPFIGASPDGIIECLCHGRGTLEIKCLCCHRGEDIVNAASNDKNFCLKKDVDGSLHLDPNHAYYYQIQTQLFVCDVNYCDFCVATFADSGNRSGLHVEQIYKNSTLWSQCVKQSSAFFGKCVLPELMGSWFTRPLASEDQTDESIQSFVTQSTSQAVIASLILSQHIATVTVQNLVAC